MMSMCQSLQKWREEKRRLKVFRNEPLPLFKEVKKVQET